MSKKALIFGVTGQDGAYLAEFLLGKGYEVQTHKRAIRYSKDSSDQTVQILQRAVRHKFYIRNAHKFALKMFLN